MRLGRKTYLLIVIASFVAITSNAQSGILTISDLPSSSSFPLAAKTGNVSLYFDKKDATVVGIAAKAFSGDLAAVTGRPLKVINTKNTSGNENIIVTGTIGHCEWLDELVQSNRVDIAPIKDQWERFIITVVEQGGRKILVIAGSDRRGTAYGLFHLSRAMGVSPFVWWADIVPAARKELYVNANYISPAPSVKYRGIFINDEDWGLQPWAAKNMDRDIKDIGPKTYAKVFELLLRLKANYIWPAMHPCTKAFYYYKENPKVADDYAIIVGGSHCEPMLRNNVFEWTENFEKEYGKKPGEWRYDQNKEEIYRYWKDRVKESAGYESVYTVGMRGIHDGSMPGPRNMDEKLKLLETVIDDQRKILGLDLHKPVSEVPQVFIPYKEVLSLYRRGLKLDDDITIIWPDDNQGYIRQLPNENERKRSGGHGIYYHLSYWGSPHDYLWLSSISPALIGYEMNKAFYFGADRLWVFNVGDIKPAELELQFAMDLAWDIKKYPADKGIEYIREWAAGIFGEKNADEITAVKKEYYELAQACKPEHIAILNPNVYELEARVKRYETIAAKVNQLQKQIPQRLQDAYFELIAYPVLSAMLMNRKMWMMEKCEESVIRLSKEEAVQYRAASASAFDSIKLLTNIYNTKIASGKWNGIMDWQPRRLAVFNGPPTIDSLEKKYARIELTTNPPYEPIMQASIDPSQWVNKNENGSVVIKEIKGLGLNGKAVAALPADYNEWKNIYGLDSVYLEYETNLSSGSYTVLVKCLPVFGTGNDKKLPYSISFDDQPPVTGDVYTEADSDIWKKNVIRGYSEGRTMHWLHKEGKTRIRLGFKTTGLVVNAIEIY